jgi:hypothetical protein
MDFNRKCRKHDETSKGEKVSLKISLVEKVFALIFREIV